MRGMDHWAGMMGGMAFWVIFAAVLLIALATGITVLIVWAVKRAPTSPATPVGTQDAKEILRRRFAAGEIEDEEFNRRLAVLDGK